MKIKGLQAEFKALAFAAERPKGMLFVFASGEHIGNDCHACAPDIWAAHFVPDENGKWTAEHVSRVEERGGTFGKPWNAEIRDLGKKATGIILSGSAMGQGHGMDGVWIYRPTGGAGFFEVLKLTTEYYPACGEGEEMKNNCTREEKMTFKFLNSSHEGLFDVQADFRSEGLDTEGKVVKSSSREIYVFDGVQYKKK